MEIDRMAAISSGKMEEMTKMLAEFVLKNPGTESRIIVATPSYGKSTLEGIWERLKTMEEMEEQLEQIFEKPEPKITFKNGSTITVSVL